MTELFNRLKKGNPRTSATHTCAYDKGVFLHGWLIGPNPFNPAEGLFLTNDGEMMISNMDAIREKKPKAGIHLTSPLEIAVFKDLVNKVSSLEPATRDRHPGIGAGMLNTLIDHGKKLKHILE